MSLGAFDMKPKAVTDTQKIQDDFKGDVTTMVREDGKEVVVAKSAIANHLERGFTLKTSPLKKNIKADKPKTEKTTE